MQILFRILPAILCFAMLVPSASADETYIKLDALTAAYGDSDAPVTESLYLGDYEEPQETTISTESEETVEPTENTETIEATETAEGKESTEAILDTAEASSGIMEELVPVYEILVTGCNLITICICALGLIAGILLGFFLWRWLK